MYDAFMTLTMPLILSHILYRYTGRRTQACAGAARPRARAPGALRGAGAARARRPRHAALHSVRRAAPNAVRSRVSVVCADVYPAHGRGAALPRVPAGAAAARAGGACRGTGAVERHRAVRAPRAQGLPRASRERQVRGKGEAVVPICMREERWERWVAEGVCDNWCGLESLICRPNGIQTA